MLVYKNNCERFTLNLMNNFNLFLVGLLRNTPFTSQFDYAFVLNFS
jgi:hypothetical protein